MKTFYASLLALALCGATVSSAQDTLRPRWSLFGGLAINTHTADFRALPGVPNCCPRFENGSGRGAYAGVGYEFPVAGSLLLSLNAGYMDHSALLSTREAVAVASGGEVRSGQFEHTIDATVAGFGLEPALGVRLAGGLFVRGGLRIGMVLSPAYAQKEEIVAPEGTGTFLDSLGNDSGSRTRNVNSGDLPDAASVLVHAVAGLEYELPMDARGTFLLVPGISYALGLTDVVSGNSWKPSALRLSLGLKYSPLPSKEVLRDTAYLRDTVLALQPRGSAPGLRLDRRHVSTEEREEGSFILERTTILEHYIRDVPKASTMSAKVTAVGVDAGREEAVATLRIEEFNQMNAHPLLGYIFFGEGSAEIPARYVRVTHDDAERFQPKTLFGEDAMGIAHNVLNIIGHNLRQYPDALLTITGCNAGNGQEQGNRTLSRDRAESVKRYLVDVWGIAPERLSVVERDLPAVPSNQRTPEGSAENRRVEITSNVPEVTDVFVAYDTTRTASPPSLRFRPVVASSDPVVSWKLAIYQHGELLKEFSGQGTPPRSLDWDIAGEKRNMPRFSEPLIVQLEALSSDGERSEAETSLPTDVITLRRKEAERARDYRIEQYNLVLFDVGKSTITTAHRRTAELIRSRLKPGSMITVEGYTDRTGDEGANRLLARGRAQSTAAALGRADAKVIGIGEDRLLYDNDTPEGRFYCRTVRVTVRTPMER